MFPSIAITPLQRRNQCILHPKKLTGGKARWELHRNGVCFFERIQEAAPHKTAIALRQLAFLFTKHSSKTNDIVCTLGEAGRTHKQSFPVG